MNNIKEMLKKVPLPIWIGLGLVLLLILLMNRGGSSGGGGGGGKQVAGGTVTAPVTGATVGSSGGGGGSSGTDQELGNLSGVTQSGFEQLVRQEQTNQSLLMRLNNNMSGIGTPMQQFGSSMQSVQNMSALDNANNGTVGQNTGNNPLPISPFPNPPFPYFPPMAPTFPGPYLYALNLPYPTNYNPPIPPGPNPPR